MPPKNVAPQLPKGGIRQALQIDAKAARSRSPKDVKPRGGSSKVCILGRRFVRLSLNLLMYPPDLVVPKDFVMSWLRYI